MITYGTMKFNNVKEACEKLDIKEEEVKQTKDLFKCSIENAIAAEYVTQHKITDTDINIYQLKSIALLLSLQDVSVNISDRSSTAVTVEPKCSPVTRYLIKTYNIPVEDIDHPTMEELVAAFHEVDNMYKLTYSGFMFCAEHSKDNALNVGLRK